ncbi:CYTH domain-containing protein [Staphylococcus intermedius]|uniref:Adenylate cyclase n=1 Tax=Staphylococcus intermedius NCTC 11048 TaxID=1141106 RepID=A0A380G857_STAIN|nr:CYTH domain-containing protein [Staphylococcus intermedius]PCF65318.1 adenylate cyclase [Staphylococcus intermedius]PCF80996.1 adenylate cyclase [Staphylococcus intermedius]PCF82278.1 adenylate cyclase [Staphylococcus intermedius]PCF86978.1 adenylate cyclase [Staphylococcus intermedius]PCF87539.1 adenylate cyclase [Staphylococcus intermedius]
MAIEREIEFKQLLDKNSYSAIKAHYFKGQAPFKQVNYYIDTPDFQIQSQKMALRIREKADGTYELTLKVPDTVGLLEYNAPFQIQPVANMTLEGSQIDDDIREVLQQRHVQLDQLKILGALTTFRLETKTVDGLLVLDHSLYLGTEDYELEFEVSDFKAGQQAFNDLLAELKLSPVVPKNKVQRFFEYQREHQ